MRRGFAIVVLLAAASLVSCSAPVRRYACTVEPAEVEVDVHSVWSCNRDVLRRVVRHKPFSIREFRSAARFFEQVTGLQVDTRRSHLGGLPGPDLKQDLRDLDAWYELNRDALRWDAGLGQVVYEGLATPGGAV